MEIRDSVKWFAEQMELKLQENDAKGGWDDCGIYWLLERLREETRELEIAIDIHRDLGAPHNNIVKEAADVANFAMMVADIAQKTK